MRRVITFIVSLFIALSPISCFSEVFAVNYISGAVIVDESGNTIIPAGTYDRLYVLRNDSGKHVGYAAGKMTDSLLMYAVLNSDAEVLTEFKYSGVWEAGNGCIVNDNGVYRYLTGSGVYDSYRFSNIEYIGSGRLLVTTGNAYDDIGDQMSILWSDGITLNTGITILNGFREYSEGLMPLLDDRTSLYGYVDTQGSWAIEPTFLYAGDFLNGLAIIGTENGYGVIDTSGHIRLAASSRQLARTDSLFAAIRGDTLRIYDSKLTQTGIIELYGTSVSLTSKYLVISGSDSDSVYDLYGAHLFTIDGLSSISCVAEGKFIVRQGNWGEACVALRNIAGELLSEPCNSIYMLDDNRYAYGLGDEPLFGLMDTDGNFITEAKYISLAYVTDGIYCADIENGAVLIDADGNIINTFKAYNADLQN